MHALYIYSPAYYAFIILYNIYIYIYIYIFIYYAACLYMRVDNKNVLLIKVIQVRTLNVLLG